MQMMNLDMGERISTNEAISEALSKQGWLESSQVERDNDNARNDGFEQGASRREKSDFGGTLVMDGQEHMIKDDGSSSEQD